MLARCQALVVTSPSKVVKWTPLKAVVPENHQETGHLLLNRPSAKTLPIQEALRSPRKVKVSISGKIVQEEKSKTVKVNGQDVTIKNITVEDGSGRAKVTLWRDAAAVAVRPGDFVSLTDVQTNIYNDVTSLSTTLKSMKIDAPVIVETVMVMSLSVHDEVAEIYCEDHETEITVPAELLQQALSADWTPAPLGEVCDDGPFLLSLKRNGSEILSISLCN